MRPLRAVGIGLAAAVVMSLAAGTAYLVYLLRVWGTAVRATDPFDPSEPI